LQYKSTTQEVVLWLTVHLVAAHHTDVDLILAIKEKRKIFPTTAKQLYTQWIAREKNFN